MSNFPSNVSSQERINALEFMVAKKEEEKKLLIDSNEKMKKAFNKITQNYIDCLQKIRNECERSYKAVIKELHRKLKKQEERIEDLESENEVLSKEINGYEDYLSNQVEQMKKLSYYLDFLGPDSDKRQNDSATTFQEENTYICPSHTPNKNLNEAKSGREQENYKTLLELLQSEKTSRQNTEETLSQTMRMCEDLMHKNQLLKHQNEMFSAQCEEIKELRAKAQKTDKLESERKGLVSKLRECMCHMNNQDATISSLTYDMEANSKEYTEKEEELNTTIEELKSQILENERQLRENKEQLEQLAMEKMCMSEHVKELERQVSHYEYTMNLNEENNKMLLHTLDQEKKENLNLQNALLKVTKLEQRLGEMLAQARCTIRSITQKLEAYDIERLETRRDAQIKISELEARLMIANCTINKLRGNLDQMKDVMDKNVALRTLSAQLHQTANAQVTKLQNANEDLSKKSQNMAETYNYLKKVLYEKDKTFDDLRKQLVGLKEQLDNEQRLRADTELALEDVAAAGNSEVANLKHKIQSLKREIDCLKKETENLMDTSTVGKLKTRTRRLEQENAHLKSEVSSYVNYLQDTLPRYIADKQSRLKKQVKELNMEVKKQKQEAENQRKMRTEAVKSFKSKLEQEEERYRKLEHYLSETGRLRSERRKLQTVVIVEKETKDDGEPRYRCLYAAEGDRKRKEEKNEVAIIQKHEHGDQKQEPNKIIQAIKVQLSETEQLIDPVFFEEENKNLKGEVRRLKKELQSLKSKPSPEKAITAQRDDPQLVRMSSKLKPIEDENKRLKEKIEELNGEIKRLKKKLESVESLVAGPDGTPENQNTAILEIKKSSEIEFLEEENKGLKKELKQLKKDLEILKSARQPQSADFSSERDKLLDEIDSQKREIADLLHKIQNPSIDVKDEELAELKEGNEKLKNMLRNAQAEIEKLRSFAIPKGNKEATEMLAPLKQALEMEQRRVSEMQDLWNQSEERSDTLKKKLAELSKENSKLKMVGAELKERTKAPSASQLYINQLEYVNRDMDNWKEIMEDSIKNIKNTISENGKDDTKLEEAVQQINNLKQKLDEAISKKKATISQNIQENHIRELEKQVNELQAENARLKKEDQELAEALEQLKKKAVLKISDQSGTEDAQRLEDMELKVRQLKRKNSNLEAEVERLRFQKMSLLTVSAQEFPDETKMENLKDTVQKLREEIDYLRQKAPRTESREQLFPVSEDDKNTRVKELEERLEEWQRNYNNDIGKLRAKIQAMQDLPEGVEEYATRIGELETELADLRSRNAFLEKNNALLEAENQQFTRIPEDEDGENVEDPEGKKFRQLVEHLRALERRNETMKTRIIQLELDNGRLRDDLDRIMGKENRAFAKEIERLRELEKQSTRCQEKYQNLKKRLMKVEIENKNLKKEYINTLIEKEKLILQGHEQVKRLRETNKLWRKTQDKKQSLTSRLIKLQVENETLKQQLDSVLNKALDEHMEKHRATDQILEARNKALETENEQLRNLIHELGGNADNPESTLPPEVQQFLFQPRDDELKYKLLQLEVENQNLKEQLESLKSKDVVSIEGDLVDQRVAEKLTDLTETDDVHKLKMKTVELEIENDFLKHEIESRDTWGTTEKRTTELEDEMHKLMDTNENLKTITVELELENEYLKKEVTRLTQESQAAENTDKDLEKQNHALKMKIENLEAEAKKLRQETEQMSQIQMSLETHVQQKVITELRVLLREYQDLKNSLFARSSTGSVAKTDIENVENRLLMWKSEYEPQIIALQRDLESLMGKESKYVASLENQLNECKGKVAQVELENKNFRVALEVLLKEKDVIKNVKLVREVETQLHKHRNVETLKKITEVDERKIEELEQRLQECQHTNKLLREEKTSLGKHAQDQKIRDLEAQLRQYQASKTDPPKHGRKNSVLNIPDANLNEVAQLKTALKKMETDMERLRKEKSTSDEQFKYQLNICQNEKEQFANELERLRKLTNLQQRVKTDLEKELEDLRNSTSDIVLAKKASRERRVVFDDEEKFIEYEKENMNLKEECLALHEKIEEKTKRILELEEQLKKCQDVNKRLRKEGDKSSSEETSGTSGKMRHRAKDKRGRDNEEDSSGRTNSEDQLTDEEQKVEDVQKENYNLKTKLHEAELHLMENRSEMETLIQDFDQLHQENQELQNKVTGLETRLRELESEYAKANVQLEKLENDRSVIQSRKAHKRIIQLEGQLIETRAQNEINIAKVEYLRKQVASHDVIEKENKHLKDDINRLTQKINSYDEDNRKLRNHINELTQEKHELIQRIDDHKREISDLQKERVGFVRRNNDQEKDITNMKKERNELIQRNDDQKQEIHELKREALELFRRNDDQKKEIDELQKERHELIKKSGDQEKEIGDLLRRNENQRREIDELQNQVRLLGGGEFRDVSKELEERNTENEQLKVVVSELQEQVNQAKLEVEEGKRVTSQKRLRKLEETLSKYQDNNEYLKMKIDNLENEKANLMGELNAYVDEETATPEAESSSNNKLKLILQKYQHASQNLKEKAIHTERVGDLEGQVRQCQFENERLKLVTIQLEAEINCLKRDISSIRNEISPSPKSKQLIGEDSSLEGMENELVRQKNKWKSIVLKLTQEYEENMNLLRRRLQPFAPENPWMMDSPQTTLIPTTYTAMPFTLQPMMNYYPPPHPINDKCAEGLHQLPQMFAKIQQTLNKSKRVLDSELVKATAPDYYSDYEELEQASLDYETGIETALAIPQYTDIDENIAELQRQFIKQQETKAKIEKLHTDIQETIKTLREVAQERSTLADTEEPSSSGTLENVPAQRECSSSTSRSSNTDTDLPPLSKIENLDSEKCPGSGKAAKKKSCDSTKK